MFYCDGDYGDRVIKEILWLDFQLKVKSYAADNEVVLLSGYLPTVGGTATVIGEEEVCSNTEHLAVCLLAIKLFIEGK